MTQGNIKISLIGLLGTTLSVSALAVDTGNVDQDGDGLIEISTLEELNQIRDQRDGSSFSGNSAGCPETGCIGYELTADLDFDTSSDGSFNADDSFWNDGSGFEPIGTSDAPFSAVFEGNGHTLNHFYTNRSGDYVSFFGKTSSATIQNLTVSGTSSSDGNYLAGLVSYADGGTLTGLHFSGDVTYTGTEEREYTAALVAYLLSSSLSNSDVTSTTVTGHNTVGGLVGFIRQSSISQSHIDGESWVKGNQNVGGLVGHANWNNGGIATSYSAAGVKAASYVGGLIGRSRITPLNQVFVVGNVQGESVVGGLLGSDNSSLIANVYVRGKIKSGRDVAGLIGLGEFSGASNAYVAVSVMGQSAYASLIASETYENSNTINSVFWDSDTLGVTPIGLTFGDAKTTSELTTPVSDTDPFASWDTTIWDFGTGTEYPAMIIDGTVVRLDENTTVLTEEDTSDADDDGVVDSEDAFPNNDAESVDSDGDGVGNNADAFPNDATENQDSDADGIGDNADLDDDNDGTPDTDDQMPKNPDETLDTDNDGIGNNTDDDDDGDGVLDEDDYFPLDPYASTKEEAVDADGNGLIDIHTLANLDAIRTDSSGATLAGSFAGCPAEGCTGFELLSDLDFDTNADGVLDENDAYWNQGAGWTPISEFSTTLQGNGHRISNLFINAPTSGFSSIGLFATLSNATITDLILDGELASVTGNYFGTSTGALAGVVQGATLSGITSYVPVHMVATAFPLYAHAGGLVGKINSTFDERINIITNTTVYADVNALESGGGGVGGIAGTGNSVEASGLIYEGTITSASVNTGGLFGFLGNASTLALSRVNASIDASNSEVGGLVGYAADSTAHINDSFSEGQVTGTANVGAIVGSLQGSNLVSYVYSRMTVSGVNALIGNAPASALIFGYYSTTANPDLATSDGAIGVTDTEMACPTSASDETCANDILFSGWSSSYWDFGTSEQLPVLVIDDVPQRDSDGDGVFDRQDAFPDQIAASVDSDSDGVADTWNNECDETCQAASGLVLDAFPTHTAVSVDSDADGFADAWNDACDDACQTASGLTLDAFPDNAAASADEDEDGLPDAWNDDCDSECQRSSGLTLDDVVGDETGGGSSGGGSVFWLLGLLIPAALGRRKRAA